jgi:anti-sigma B factor antagonist
VVTVDLLCSNGCVDRHAVFVVAGEIDLASADQVRQAALEVMDRDGPALTLDLAQVTFMDCSGLSMLLILRKEADTRGGHLTLAGLPDMVFRLLHLVGLLAFFGLPESAPSTSPSA